MLVLIDRGTAERDHWSDLQPELLGQIGIYDVWRLDRSRLEQRAQTLKAEASMPTGGAAPGAVLSCEP